MSSNLVWTNQFYFQVCSSETTNAIVFVKEFKVCNEIVLKKVAPGLQWASQLQSIVCATDPRNFTGELIKKPTVLLLHNLCGIVHCKEINPDNIHLYIYSPFTLLDFLPQSVGYISSVSSWVFYIYLSLFILFSVALTESIKHKCVLNLLFWIWEIQFVLQIEALAA